MSYKCQLKAVTLIQCVLFGFLHLNARQKPNIILILADDWGYGDIAVEGNGKPSPFTPNGIQEELMTPFLDQMVAEGTFYTQFYQNAAHCVPTRASIMKGQFSRRTRHVREPLPWLPVVYPILPQVMKDAGYVTAQYGKWHLQSANSEEAAKPPEYGIDEHMIMPGGGDASDMMPDNVTGWKRMPDKPNWRQWATSDIVDTAINFIERHLDQPFFINAWIFDTHWPLSPLPEQTEPYSHLDENLADYYGAVTDSDKHIGRLFAKLKELGIDSNTIVIFCSDNGPEVSNSNGNLRGSTAGLRGAKRSGYEGGIRSPFIVWWPGTTPAGGVDSTTVISGADLLPSFVALAGGTMPPSDLIDGEDMSHAFRGIELARERPLLYHLGITAYYRTESGGTDDDPEIHNPLVIARDGKWKMFQNPDGSGVELFDIWSDPFEENDVAGSNPDVVTALKELLDTWMDGNTNVNTPTGPVPESVMDWPGQKKVTGCTDPDYAEYDPLATQSDNTLCITQTRINIRAANAFQWNLRGFNILEEGEHTIRMYGVKGNQVADITGHGWRFHTWPGVEPGLYLMRIETQSGSHFHRVFIGF